MTKKTLDKKIKDIFVYGFTEYTYNDNTYRAHPSYKKESSWFDWMFIAWTAPFGKNRSKISNKFFPEFISFACSDDFESQESIAVLIPAQIVWIIKEEMKHL